MTPTVSVPPPDDNVSDGHCHAATPNPDFRLVIMLAGVAIGAIAGIVALTVAWPETSQLASIAVTAIAAVAGGAISMGATFMYVRQVASVSRTGRKRR